ncbi:hypothetical protein F5Y18DRAFT_368656 [Xylariaceae sp. FL1019]|nr:hypothetical protein F5Y18DRAFT_368656 [Xylariaceae sp. FL1019]
MMMMMMMMMARCIIRRRHASLLSYGYSQQVFLVMIIFSFSPHSLVAVYMVNRALLTHNASMLEDNDSKRPRRV